MDAGRGGGQECPPSGTGGGAVMESAETTEAF